MFGTTLSRDDLGLHGDFYIDSVYVDEVGIMIVVTLSALGEVALLVVPAARAGVSRSLVLCSWRRH